MILSNVPGVMKDMNTPESRIGPIARVELDQISEDFAEGRMKIKLLAAGQAIDGGVKRVIISDARPKRCISGSLAPPAVFSNIPDMSV